MKRQDGREYNQLRPLKITHNIYEYAPGSVLIELGKTKILCAVTLQPSVPSFLRGQGLGWLTAEYALLPASTQARTQREISVMRRQHRSVEISRLIGRSLRSIVNFSALGERTIYIDCDVLQADGGTRTASITGAYVALVMAEKKWKAERIINSNIITQSLAAISVAVMQNGLLVLDPDYIEDSNAIADINFCMTHTGEVVEVQGGAEQSPISWQKMNEAGLLAQDGIRTIARALKNEPTAQINNTNTRVPFFSLSNRQKQDNK